VDKQVRANPIAKLATLESIRERAAANFGNSQSRVLCNVNYVREDRRSFAIDRGTYKTLETVLRDAVTFTEALVEHPHPTLQLTKEKRMLERELALRLIAASKTAQALQEQMDRVRGQIERCFVEKSSIWPKGSEESGRLTGIIKGLIGESNYRRLEELPSGSQCD